MTNTFVSYKGFYALCDPDDSAEGGELFRRELTNYLHDVIGIKFPKEKIKNNLFALCCSIKISMKLDDKCINDFIKTLNDDHSSDDEDNGNEDEF